MISIVNIVGIHFSDPKMPGTFYLADEEGGLTRDPKKAKRVEDAKLQAAMRQVHKVTRQIPFSREVAAE